MPEFNGFSTGSEDSVPIPGEFFTELVPVIDNLDELRVTLYAFWYISGQLREPRYLAFSEILKDDLFMSCFGGSTEERERKLTDGLKRACARGALLQAQYEEDTLYFINSGPGRAAMEGVLNCAWNPGSETPFPLKLQKERPNIYALYEQNIGPLTPILAETLQDAENSYPQEWIADAIKIAVTRNVRHWQYVEAVLKSWKEKGRDGTDRKTSEEKRKRDSEGEFADFINH